MYPNCEYVFKNEEIYPERDAAASIEGEELPLIIDFDATGTKITNCETLSPHFQVTRTRMEINEFEVGVVHVYVISGFRDPITNKYEDLETTINSYQQRLKNIEKFLQHVDQTTYSSVEKNT